MTPIKGIKNLAQPEGLLEQHWSLDNLEWPNQILQNMYVLPSFSYLHKEEEEEAEV